MKTRKINLFIEFFKKFTKKGQNEAKTHDLAIFRNTKDLDAASQW